MSVGDNEHFVIIGRPESGYSMKVRSAMRFKGVPHEWMDRCHRTDPLFHEHATVQLIPLVFRPDGTATQDSTPILEELEERYPEPSLHPTDPGLRFLSEVIEEYGDEWANKLMFHHRWGYRPDQKHRSGTLARGMLEGHPLRPIFAREVGPRFLAWDAANAAAREKGDERTELEMEGRRYYQKTFKYPAQGLSILRQKLKPNATLRSFLDETGCLQFLEPTGAAEAS